jgi:hypothetical protein
VTEAIVVNVGLKGPPRSLSHFDEEGIAAQLALGAARPRTRARQPHCLDGLRRDRATFSLDARHTEGAADRAALDRSPPEASVHYDELPMINEIGYRHAWDVWGRDDHLGTINRLTPERVRYASRLVASGEVIALSLPVHLPDPPLFGRGRLDHIIEASSRNGWDDHFAYLNFSSSSQWDGLGHIRCREFGFYGGRQTNPEAGGFDLGIDHWARHGIVGRGLLIDLVADRAARGKSLHPFAEEPVSAAELSQALDRQGSTLLEGDILCIRFGWTEAYHRLGAEQRRSLATGPLKSVGLAADDSTARFLWDNGCAAVACDNPAVEVWPGNREAGSLHRRLIPLLGFAIGELFDFERLARACARANRFEFLFVAAPANVRGGVNSAANAVAIL